MTKIIFTIVAKIALALVTLGFLVPPLVNAANDFMVIAGFLLAMASITLIVLEAIKIVWIFLQK